MPGCVAWLKANPLGLGCFSLLLSFLLLSAACGLRSQLVQRVDYNMQATATLTLTPYDATPHAAAFHGMASALALPLLPLSPQSALLAPQDSQSNSQSTSISLSEKVSFGFFQLCVKMSIDVFQGDTHTVDFNPSSPYCSVILPNCKADLSALQTDLWEALGGQPSGRPDGSDETVLDNCALYNSARAFAALSAIFAGVGILFVALLWRRKIPLIALEVCVVCTALFALLCFALTVTYYAQHSSFGDADTVPTNSPPGLSNSKSFGDAYFLLLTGFVLAVLAAIGIGIEVWRRSDGGRINPFARHSNVESGILESHVSMYQQM